MSRHTRRCVKCGREITRCFGFVKAGDFQEALDGYRPWEAVRELCGICPYFWQWAEDGGLIPRQAE